MKHQKVVKDTRNNFTEPKVKNQKIENIGFTVWYEKNKQAWNLNILIDHSFSFFIESTKS